MAGVQSHGRHTACTHTGHPPGCTFHSGRVDVSSSHDDHVLGPAADHDMAQFGQIAQIPSAVPALLVLSKHETRHRHVSGCHRLSAQLYESYTADWLNGTVVVDHPGLYALQRRS